MSNNSPQHILRAIRAIPEVESIIQHPLFLSMEEYRHHGTINCLDHSIKVAIAAYTISQNYTVDIISVLRGALLHDFYLYDWHTDSPGLHGFKHPYISLRNAKQNFPLNKIEIDAIKRHMWPLTPIPPRYKESIIVSIADKTATWQDYLSKESSADTIGVIELSQLTD